MKVHLRYGEGAGAIKNTSHSSTTCFNSETVQRNLLKDRFSNRPRVCYAVPFCVFIHCHRSQRGRPLKRQQPRLSTHRTQARKLYREASPLPFLSKLLMKS